MVRFRQELFTLEKDKDMPYVDTLTRMSREEGSLAQTRESLIEALEIRFGEISAEPWSAGRDAFGGHRRLDRFLLNLSTLLTTGSRLRLDHERIQDSQN